MEAMLNQGTQFTVEGQTYTVRRLGIRDVFAVARILTKLGKTVLKDGMDIMKKQDNESLGFLIMSAIPECEDEVLSLLASLIGKTKQEFECLPPVVLTEVVAAVVQSEDLKAFFASVQKALGTVSTTN